MKYSDYILIALNLILFVGCDIKTDGYEESLDGNFKLYYGSHEVDLLDKNNVVLVTDIWGYVKNDSFLLAYRNANRIEDYYDSLTVEWRRKYPRDSIQYWIVKTSSDSVLGPFNKPDYEQIRLLLRITPSLTIDVNKESVRRF